MNSIFELSICFRGINFSILPTTFCSPFGISNEDSAAAIGPAWVLDKDYVFDINGFFGNGCRSTSNMDCYKLCHRLSFLLYDI